MNADHWPDEMRLSDIEPHLSDVHAAAVERVSGMLRTVTQP
jgi:hypothetical protein